MIRKTFEFLSFQEVYNKMKPRLSTLEMHRQDALTEERLYVLLAFLGVLLGVVGLLGYLDGVEANLAVSIAMMFVGVLFIYLGFKLRGRSIVGYKESLKEAIQRGIVKAIDPAFRYESRCYFQEEVYHRSQLFRDNEIQVFHGKNSVTGKLGKTDFGFSELLSLEEFNEESYDPYTKVFLHADFHKHFEGLTFVFPRSFRTSLKKLKTAFYTQILEPVQLEDNEFNKLFVVYSSNQVEARYILSPTMMEALIEIWKKFDGRIEISFHEGEMFLTTKRAKDFLFPFWGVKAIDECQVRSYYDEIMLYLKAIDDLNLNTRIWSQRPE